jgi:hypothetical protein
MRITSLLIGAGLAAMVSLPALAADNWVNGSWQTYDARNLKVDSVVGTVRIDVKESGPMAVQVSGLPERVKRVHVRASGGTLEVDSEQVGTVWDWRHWFDFNSFKSNKPAQLQVHIAVPRGTPIDIDETSGNVTIGNSMGPLKFSVQGYTESTVGNVTSAKLEMAGAGKLTVGHVYGPVEIETAGSGNIRIGDAARVKAEIAGSGSITTGAVNGPLEIDIAGSGDFSAASVRGSANATIAGSGSVTIAGGEADPLRVEIMGSGNVSFGGMAVNPKIEAMGSGSVRIKAYRGNLQNDGAKLNIGG